MQFKNRWSPSINKHPRLKNLQCWNPFFIQQFLFPILFISIYFSPPARWGLLDFMSVACSSPLLSSPLLLLLLNRDPRSVCPAGPQPRPSTLSVPCRTSTTTIPAQCSLPDLNREYPRPVFPAGPQPRPSTPSVPCRTSTASIHAKCSLPDLM